MAQMALIWQVEWGVSRLFLYCSPQDLARASCASQLWWREVFNIRNRAARLVQSAVRYALAKLRVARLRRAHFEFVLHSDIHGGSPGDFHNLPQNIWAARQACVIDEHFGIEWAILKLQRYNMPVAAHAIISTGPGLLRALALTRNLNIEQMMCLGV